MITLVFMLDPEQRANREQEILKTNEHIQH